MAQTPYAETEALLATLRGDDQAAERTVDAMTPTERREFLRTLDRLRGTVARVSERLRDFRKPPLIDDPGLWTS